MRLLITVSTRTGDENSPDARKLRALLYKTLAAYGPRRLKDKWEIHEFQFPHQELGPVLSLLKPFKKAVQGTKLITVWSDLSPDADEIKRARFLPLLAFADAADQEVAYPFRPLNAFPHALCEKCKFPDVSRPANPYVLAKPPAATVEMLGSDVCGLLIVRPRVLELLQAAVGDQIEVGDVVVKGKGKPSAADRLHWVRPIHRIGDNIGKTIANRCPACSLPAKSYDPGGTREIKLTPEPRVAHYGDGKADIALIDGYFGGVEAGVSRWTWNVAVSGALFTYLKENGVKGISTAPGGDPARCYFSEKGEPTFLDEPRSFSTAATKTATIKPAEKPSDPAKNGAKLVASLKDVPWDRTKDGFVYLYLTSPELVVIDPMTFEEDSGGPYKLKNFKPGLHRLPASAIVEAKGKRGIAVDSASLLLIDGAFYADLQQAFEWDKSNKSNGAMNKTYLDKVAKQIGNRFGVCSIDGDGDWMIDSGKIERVK